MRSGSRAWQPDLVKIEELAARGLTQEQIAHACSITPQTLSKYKYSDTDLAAAISRGQARGIGEVANKLFEAAMRGNVVAAIFYLKARAGWREQDSSSLQQGPIAALIVPGVASAEDWAKMYGKYKEQAQEAQVAVQ